MLTVLVLAVEALSVVPSQPLICQPVSGFALLKKMLSPGTY
jgi:hypothetical protein